MTKTKKKAEPKKRPVKKSTVKQPKSTHKAKIAKAEELRRKVVSTQREERDTVNKWIKASSAEKGAKQKQIDSAYEKKIEAVRKRGDKAYEKYYKYVHSEFTPEQVKKADTPKGQFIDRPFINRLASMEKNNAGTKEKARRK